MCHSEYSAAGTRVLILQKKKILQKEYGKNFKYLALIVPDITICKHYGSNDNNNNLTLCVNYYLHYNHKIEKFGLIFTPVSMRLPV